MTDKPNYQTLSDELDDILQKLQDGEVSIDEAMPAYERGVELIRQLEKHLKTTENQIEKLQAKLQD